MRPVKKLSDLEIDEVSLVDRPANQHGLVAIAKRGAKEEAMPEIYDAEGYPVEEDELQEGDVVYDEQGAEYVFTEDVGDDGTSGQFDDGDVDEGYADQYEGELVGKRGPLNLGDKVVRRTRNVANLGRRRGRQAGERATAAYQGARTNVSEARRGFNTGWGGQTPLTHSDFGGNAARTRGAAVGSHLRQNRVGYGAGAGVTSLGAAGGGGAYVHHRRSQTAKSLGSQVYEELSKALDDGDRDEVIAKAMDLVEEAGYRASQAERVAKQLADERDLEEFVELAKGYDVPADPEDLGLVLKNCADFLPDDQLALLDRVLASVSDDRFVEKGYAGDMGPSEIMDQVQVLALDAVSKADISPAEAVVGLFETNPEAYDQYLAEQRG